MNGTILFRALLAGLVVLVGSCASGDDDVESESHFLSVCASDAECGDLACLCGVCTKRCTSKDTCAALSKVAECAASSDQVCDAPSNVCVAKCETSTDCAAFSSGLSCVNGQCAPSGAATDASTDAPSADAGDADVAVEGAAPVAGTSMTDAFPTAFAVGPSGAYWVDGSESAVKKVPLDGGSPITVATGVDGVSGLAVSAAGVFWTGFRALMKAPLDGGSAVSLAPNQNLLGGVTADDTNVYWVDGASVMKISVDGGSPETLAADQGAPAAITTDGVNVYWTDTTAGTVTKVGVGGGTPEALASGQDQPGAIATDGTNVYFMNAIWAGDSLTKVPVGGGTPVSLAVSPSSSTPHAGIAVDGTRAYWAGVTLGTPGTPGPMAVAWIRAVAVAGGDPTTIVSNENLDLNQLFSGFAGLGVQGGNLYWAVPGNGTSVPGAIMKATLSGGTP